MSTPSSLRDATANDASFDAQQSPEESSPPTDASASPPDGSLDADGDDTSDGSAAPTADGCVPVATAASLQGLAVCSSTSLCGNGRVDAPCRSLDPEASTAVVEQCDGTDLNCQTCWLLGYSGGALACRTGWGGCQFDVEGCRDCVDGPSTSCGTVRNSSGAFRYLLAATDAEIGLVLGSIDPGTSNHLLRLAKDFTVLSDTAFSFSHIVAGLAPTATGWLAAGVDVHGVSLTSFDATGGFLGVRDVAVFPSNVADQGGSLVGRPGGGPLLVWGEAPDSSGGLGSGTFHAQVLADDGTAVGAEASFSGASSASGAFVGDGFELALDVGASPQVQLVHIALDGSVRTDPNLGTGYALGVLASGSEAEVVLGCCSALLVQKVAQGGALGSPTSLPFFASGPAVAFDGSGILAWSWSASGALPATVSLERVPWSATPPAEGGAGAPQGLAFSIPVARSGQDIPAFATAFQGGDVLAAWPSLGSNVQLVRVTPPP